MADAFICCHVASAGEIARQIASELKKYGISCWYAATDLYDSDSVGVIAREIRKCKVFLLILNQDALKSRYMESEIALAYRRMMNYEKLTFLPFRADDCDWKSSPISYYLNRFQVMNGAPPDDGHIRKLCERIARIVGGKASRRPAETEANRVAENL